MLKLVTSDPIYEDARFVHAENWEKTMPQRMPFIRFFIMELQAWKDAGCPLELNPSFEVAGTPIL